MAPTFFIDSNSFYNRPKECPALSETAPGTLQLITPGLLVVANPRPFDTAIQLALRGLVRPCDRHIITFQGAKVATDALVSELLTCITLNASIDSNRVYCPDAAILRNNTCTFRCIQQLVNVKGNLVEVVLAGVAHDAVFVSQRQS
jgi:hypothetical protein